MNYKDIIIFISIIFIVIIICYIIYKYTIKKYFQKEYLREYKKIEKLLIELKNDIQNNEYLSDKLKNDIIGDINDLFETINIEKNSNKKGNLMLIYDHYEKIRKKYNDLNKR